MPARQCHTTSKLPFLSGISQALGIGIFAVILSCKGPDKGRAAGATDATNPPSVQVVPLAQNVIKQLSNAWGIVRLNNGTLRQGIVVQTGRSPNGNPDYTILADVPDDEKRVDFVIGSAKPEFFSGVRRGKLPNGLSLFGFGSELRLESFKRHASAPGAAVRALRLSPSAALPAEEVASLRIQLEQKVQQMNALQRSESQQRSEDARSRVRRARNPRTAELFEETARLRAQMNFAIQGISATETAAGTTLEKLAGAQAAWENTVLVGQDLNVFAIRHRDQWVNLDEALDSIPTRPKSVKLSVSGSSATAQLTCALRWEIPPTSASFSLVAATTHELESQGGGSLEERLAKVAAIPFHQSGVGREISKDLSWAGKPTTLWIKVIDDANPSQPVIDEAILLDFDAALVAKWAKPPSALIELPEAAADTPEDLVKDRSVIDAGGTVLDLIPTADASVLLIQSDKPPFWATLDLKTGTLGKVPWPATPDTLVATQAGKTYLANRKTKEVEIWDNATSKRESVRLLELPGDLTSLAAPRLGTGCPVLVVTGQTAGFVSATTFKAVNCGIDLSSIFPEGRKTNQVFPKFIPATLRARASADGAVYNISGTAVESDRNTLVSISMRMSSGMVVSSDNNSRTNYIPAVGRNLVKDIPDQGGGDLSLSVARHSSQFPAPQGTIDFRTENDGRSVGVLGSAPFVPAIHRGDTGSAPAFDRRLYLDSSLGILLIPEDDKMNLLHLKLPEIPALPPEFVFGGETVKIPLPRGTGHRATSSVGGEISISGDSLSWSVPDKVSRSQGALQLDWTGELGSAMSRKLEFSMLQALANPVIVSSDGKQTIELTRRTLISDQGDCKGIAGAGNVLLTTENKKHAAWSLLDGRKLCEIDGDADKLLGDADRIYLLDHQGKLSSYDIQTGKLLQSKQFRSQSQGSQQAISDIATGSASRGALAVIALDQNKQYYAQVNRDTLDLELYDFGPAKPPEPTYRLRSNASGSVCWSFSNGILRQGNRATVKEAFGAIEGTPDASGRYLVDSNRLMDLGRTPSEKLEARELPGATANASLQLDRSGRYLLITDYDRSDPDKDSNMISVRRLGEGFKEVFKIKYTPRIDTGRFSMISSTKTLVTQGLDGSGFAVYDFDCDAIEKEIADTDGNP